MAVFHCSSKRSLASSTPTHQRMLLPLHTSPLSPDPDPAFRECPVQDPNPYNTRGPGPLRSLLLWAFLSPPPPGNHYSDSWCVLPPLSFLGVTELANGTGSWGCPWSVTLPSQGFMGVKSPEWPEPPTARILRQQGSGKSIPTPPFFCLPRKHSTH